MTFLIYSHLANHVHRIYVCVQVAQQESGATKSAPPVSVSRESIDGLLTVLKASVVVQEETADALAKRILNPLGHKISRAAKGKVTLAEMTRHLRLDRVLEALEGAIWAEKKLCSDDTYFPLRAELRDQLQTSVSAIKMVSKMLSKNHKKKTNPIITIDLMQLLQPDLALLFVNFADPRVTFSPQRR